MNGSLGMGFILEVCGCVGKGRTVGSRLEGDREYRDKKIDSEMR